jgi:hypothetical protein
MNPVTGRCTTYGFDTTAENHFEPSVELEPRLKPSNNGMRVRKLQGILALVDCREEDGGFHAVPGFHHFIRTWANMPENRNLCLAANRDSGDPTTIQIPDTDPVRQHIQRMPIRKGSLLIWDSRLPHGNYPNDSANPRIVQYMHMAPVTDLAIRPFPIDCKKDFMTGYKPSSLGKKLYGIEAWSSSLAKRRFKEQPSDYTLQLANHEREKRDMVRKAIREHVQQSRR